ncbi:MAG TPA: DUF2844 domain-containing protein [Candidatus Sulfotelmatobacter sp.]|nr:DUF2844 domain-containing protein [Candidatus Sulfotelmatobacter sp.]
MQTFTHAISGALIRGLSVALLVSLGSPSSAFGTLGGSSESIQTDQARFKAKIIVRENSLYTVHELTTSTDIVVREYVSGGRVFGVTWHGPFIPDLRQLLGSYFQQYEAAAKAERDHHVGRAPLNIQLPSLVVQTGGHMRAYFGRAYDPELLPVGISPDDVR